MMSKARKYTNNLTGERLELQADNQYSQKYAGGWIVNNQIALLRFVTSNPTKVELSIFLLINAKIQYDNWLEINQSEWARNYGFDQGNISKAISSLIEKKILIKNPNKHNCFRLNEFYGYKGNIDKTSNLLSIS